ncbi:Protocadherin-15 [Gryllus bimaculatus]|nr:Protocadherin-15 [Gryllus bimaculatus]
MTAVLSKCGVALQLTPVGSTVFAGLRARDADAGVNGLVEYFLAEGAAGAAAAAAAAEDPRLSAADGFGVFAIPLPHQGQVTLVRALDYERTQRYLLTIVASASGNATRSGEALSDESSDNVTPNATPAPAAPQDRARNASERFSTTTTLTVDVKDEDDLEPSFIYQGCTVLHGACVNPEYRATVSSGTLAGVLAVRPDRIQAVDMDSLDAPVRYSFLSGAPATYADYFAIDAATGAVRQVRAVDTAVAKSFDIIVKAEEDTATRRFATAKLVITVKPVDTSPPTITASALEGFVDENAPKGTRVLDGDGAPLTLAVSDADLLTTPFFAVDEAGALVVDEEKLDRDPPSPGKFRFQVVARERGGPAASAPLSLAVALRDVNDNAPQLPHLPPVAVPAGEGRRHVVRVEATDNDLGENAEITYSIFHVSNNGRQRFKIDPQTGDIETVGKLSAGEQYSITVQATDNGGLLSQSIVEVQVVPGPNTRSPVFEQPVYEVQVSEGAAINSTVATITAIDPEKDPVTYSIVSGNDLRQFTIGDRTGVLSVIRKLDREDLTRYQLLVKAEDTGGLSSTATVNIRVTDINDKNPEFVNDPYSFTVREGVEGAKVGVVHAVDADEGANAVVYYSVPDDVPFVVDAMTGEIRTKVALDYEKKQEHRFVVTAKDGAPDPRLATATVTVAVQDVEDELPIFHILNYPARVPENMPDFLVTQVQADDPDTNQQVTYEIRQGPTDLFRIDPRTGAIHTIRGLDYERESQYVMIIGTRENPGSKPGDTTRVDRNDIPPVFTTVPRPVTLSDDAPIGTTVSKLLATDSDGTAPNNKVRYELIGRGKAIKFFQIDSDTGVITVRDSLRKEALTEYLLEVKAYDLGDPRLSSQVQVQVFVRHQTTPPPGQKGIAFPDDTYTAEVPENATAGTLIKALTIVNGPSSPNEVPLGCNITAGNDDGLFAATISPNGRSCEVRLQRGELDHETSTSYKLTIALQTLMGLIDPMHRTSQLKVQVLDINDNTPRFIFPEDSAVLSHGKYYGAVAADAPIGTSVIQVKAEDADSGPRGAVQYALVAAGAGAGEGADFFAVDAASGVLDPAGTDVWFYLVDPRNDSVLERASARVQRSILSPGGVSNITHEVAMELAAAATVVGLHEPLQEPVRTPTTAVAAVNWDVFPYALIVIAVVILVLGVAGIVYICISWSRYKAYKERMQRMYVVPRYDPVFVEPNLKEYETQVLQMSVPLDDSDSYNDLQLDFSSKNHAFSLDSVSYLTKDHNEDSIGQQSPASSEAATTARASSVVGAGLSDPMNAPDPPLLPGSFSRASDEDFAALSASATNENVAFREKKDYSHLGFSYLGDKNAVETTTEL